MSLSASKLLKRIECADEVEQQDGKTLNDLRSHTFGITSDPLTKFAVVFSALIHDAGHPGVANTQLVKEQPEAAERYGKCHAEQISVDLSWELLMLPRYRAFRKQIFGNQPGEGQRFRQVSNMRISGMGKALLRFSTQSCRLLRVASLARRELRAGHRHFR